MARNFYITTALLAGAILWICYKKYKSGDSSKSYLRRRVKLGRSLG